MFEYNDTEYLRDKLKTDLENGLSEKEVIKRQSVNGKNQLQGKKQDSIAKTFFKQLKDPMIYILLVAILVSLFLKEITDAIVVAIVVIINALIGAFQEIKTEKALEMLKKMSTHKCYVIRDGNKKQIETTDLVKGDLVCLENGNSIGADVRIIESNNLSIDESSITGESHPVKKHCGKIDINIKSLGDKFNCAYMSTLVVGGSGKGIVVSTGMDTEIGKIASVLKEEDSITPLQKRLFDLGKLLGLLTIGVCVLMFIIALLEKRNPLDMLISSISLAVAAIPEGLPAVVTIVLAIGVKRMSERKAIVKNLPLKLS
jgi:Ca2+-transporting ATPase